VAEDMLRPGHCSEGKGKTGLRSMERASGGGLRWRSTRLRTMFAWRISPRRTSVHGHTHWRWLKDSPTKASAKGGRDELDPLPRPGHC